MVLIWGVLHCRCERTQTQQAQYNEFGRKAGSRIGPLRGLRHRSGRIVREQDHQRGRGGVKVCPRASSEDEFFFSSSDTSRLELSGVFRTAMPSLCEVSLVIYILLLPSSWPSICWSCRSLLEYLSHPALPSTCCELQLTGWHCSGVIPSLMRPDCQLRAFNAKMTGSFTIAFSPCSHSCPPTLVLSFGNDGEGCFGWCIALSFHDTNSPRTWRSSAIPPNSFGPSLVILGRFPPQLGPLGLIFEMDRGTQILWPYNSPSKSCCPDSQTGRGILTVSGLHHGWLSLAFSRALEFLRLPMARS